MNILVSGGAGFIGTHLVHKLANLGHFPIVIDDLSTGRLENIQPLIANGQVAFHRHHIHDRDAIRTTLRKERMETIVHLAAITSVGYSLSHPLRTNLVNVQGTLALVEAARKEGVRKFVFLSSAAVYGQPSTLPLHEDSRLEPISPYGASKVAAEMYLRAASTSQGINAAVLRLFNVYGKGQNPDYAGVITRFAEQLHQGKPLIIFGDGHQTRDFVHVTDVVEGIIQSIRYLESHNWGLFNIASGNPTSISELATLMIRVLSSGHIAKPIHTAARVGDIYHSAASIDRAKQELSFRPSITLQEGLADFRG